MRRYWTNPEGDAEDLWAHEWAKYGTCLSTLRPKCYSEYSSQQEVVDYFKSSTGRYAPYDSFGYPTNPGAVRTALPYNPAFTGFTLLMQYYILQDLANAGIVPSETQTYTADEIIKAFGVGYPPLLQCEKGELAEIWWYSYAGPYLLGFLIPPGMVFPSGIGPSLPRNSQLTSHNCNQVGDDSSPCPATGIKYLAKPFSGTGTIGMVGVYKPIGCLTSKGTIVYGAPCATFLATPIGW